MNCMLKQNQKEVVILINREEFIKYNRNTNKFYFTGNGKVFEMENTKERVRFILQGMPNWLKKEFKEAIKLNEQQYLEENKKFCISLN